MDAENRQTWPTLIWWRMDTFVFIKWVFLIPKSPDHARKICCRKPWNSRRYIHYGGEIWRCKCLVEMRHSKATLRTSPKDSDKIFILKTKVEVVDLNWNFFLCLQIAFSTNWASRFDDKFDLDNWLMFFGRYLSRHKYFHTWKRYNVVLY